jgi:hypothetical protein
MGEGDPDLRHAMLPAEAGRVTPRKLFSVLRPMTEGSGRRVMSVIDDRLYNNTLDS